MAKVRRMTKKRLGELLVDEGLITDEQVQEALKEQKKTKELLGEVLIRKSYVTERDIARTLATQFSLPFISARRYNVPKEVADLLPDETLARYEFVPIDRFADVLTIVVAGVVDNRALEEVEKTTGCTVKVCVGTASEVKAVRERFKADAKKAAQEAAGKAAPPQGEPAAKEEESDGVMELEKPEDEEVAKLIASMSKGGAVPEADLVVEHAGEDDSPAPQAKPEPLPKPEPRPAPKPEPRPAPKPEPKPKPAEPKKAAKAPPAKPAAKKQKGKEDASEDMSSKPQWTRKVTRKIRKKA